MNCRVSFRLQTSAWSFKSWPSNGFSARILIYFDLCYKSIDLFTWTLSVMIPATRPSLSHATILDPFHSLMGQLLLFKISEVLDTACMHVVYQPITIIIYNYFTRKLKEFYFTKGSQDQFCRQNWSWEPVVK